MKKPNILLIVTDQQRRDTIGAYGSRIVKTPYTDGLASQGVCFTHAFTPCGLCSPARSSILTGTYPHDHEVLTNVALHPIRNSLPVEKDILTPGLKSADYRSGYVGKWHVNHHKDPTVFGFDRYVSLGDYKTYRDKLGVPFPSEVNNYVVPQSAVDTVPVEHCRPAFLVDQAITMMDEFCQDGKRPFFIRVDFHGPHMPNVIPEPYASMYPPMDIPPHPNFEDDLKGKPAVQRIKRRHWGTDKMSWNDWQPLMSRYYGEISLIDAQMGRLLEHLNALGLTEDTLVIFTTDHGDTMGAHKIWNKDYTMYDEIYRVPLIIRWPGVVDTGGICDTYVHHFIDLTPTLLEVAGVDVPAGLHGQTLLPLMKGEPQERLREAFCEFHGCHMGLYTIRMLQTDRYKYVFHTNDIDELYDSKSDPAEMNNLAENPDYADVLADLRLRMVDWMAKTRDHLYNEWIVYWLTGDLERARQAPGRMNTPW
jgi:arylsulfatase A-like enzyme